MKFIIIFVLAVSVFLTSALELSHVESKQERNSSVEARKFRVTHSVSAYDGQFPYQAFLSMRVGDSVLVWCGGSLIGENWILTTAHCVKGAEFIDVYLGALRRYEAEVSVTVDQYSVIIHNDFSFENNLFKNDIALIRIPSVEYSDRIQPVKLPSISNYDSYVNEYAISTGWGKQSDDGDFAEYLMWIRDLVISNEQCEQTFGNRINSDHICVDTFYLSSICDGDNGGPLVLEQRNIQIGIAAMIANNKCEENKPAAYVRLSSYLYWIYRYTGIYYE